ncbi:hypothetical protein GCM10009665_01120 [Kitasatospora nipponensis]|uniref:Uncharacterized protein n=1 Tax=Kitasatospora nipponensis TaxID=258049 RepID=A0ABN1VKC5_9ACTN
MPDKPQAQAPQEKTPRPGKRVISMHLTSRPQPPPVPGEQDELRIIEAAPLPGPPQSVIAPPKALLADLTAEPFESPSFTPMRATTMPIASDTQTAATSQGTTGEAVTGGTADTGVLRDSRRQ